MSCKKLLGIYDVNLLPLLHKLLSDLLIASEETIVLGEEPQGSMRRFVADHEICHRLIIIEISSTDRTLELNPHDHSTPLRVADASPIKENPDGKPLEFHHARRQDSDQDKTRR